MAIIAVTHQTLALGNIFDIEVLFRQFYNNLCVILGLVTAQD